MSPKTHIVLLLSALFLCHAACSTATSTKGTTTNHKSGGGSVGTEVTLRSAATPAGFEVSVATRSSGDVEQPKTDSVSKTPVKGVQSQLKRLDLASLFERLPTSHVKTFPEPTRQPNVKGPMPPPLLRGCQGRIQRLWRSGRVRDGFRACYESSLRGKQLFGRLVLEVEVDAKRGNPGWRAVTVKEDTLKTPSTVECLVRRLRGTDFRKVPPISRRCSTQLAIVFAPRAP